MDQQQPTQSPAAIGLRKAAVLLASLPTADAAYLLRQLDEDQLRAIAQVAAGGRPNEAEQHDVLGELRSVQVARGEHLSPRRPSLEISQAHRQAKRLFARLSDASAPLLVRLLEAEIPQTIALVLAQLKPKQAAEILECLPTEKQLTVALKIAELSEPDETALTDVANVLVERSKRLGATPSAPVGGAGHLARIIQQTNSATQKALLANVGQENRPLVDQIDRHLAILHQLKRLKAA
jgi:flagellar motor switch protein FliG